MQHAVILLNIPYLLEYWHLILHILNLTSWSKMFVLATDIELIRICVCLSHAYVDCYSWKIDLL